MAAYSSVQHVACGIGSFAAGLILVEEPGGALRQYWVAGADRRGLDPPEPLPGRPAPPRLPEPSARGRAAGRPDRRSTRSRRPRRSEQPGPGPPARDPIGLTQVDPSIEPREAPSMIALALACFGFAPGNSQTGAGTATAARPDQPAREAGLRGLILDQGRWVTPDQVIGRDRDDARADPPCSPSTRTAGRGRPGLPRGRRPWPSGATRSAWRPRPSPTSRRRPGSIPTMPTPADGWAIGRTGGRWMTDAEFAAESAEAIAQARADREWGSKLADLAAMAERTRPSRRGGPGPGQPPRPPGRPLDPAVVRRPDPWEQSWAIRLLGRIDSPGRRGPWPGSPVFGVDEPVRLAALRPLLRRDPRTVRRPADQLVPRARSATSSPAHRRCAVGLLRVEGDVGDHRAVLLGPPHSEDPSPRPGPSRSWPPTAGQQSDRRVTPAEPTDEPEASATASAAIPGPSTAPTSRSS